MEANLKITRYSGEYMYLPVLRDQSLTKSKHPSISIAQYTIWGTGPVSRNHLSILEQGCFVWKNDPEIAIYVQYKQN